MRGFFAGARRFGPGRWLPGILFLAGGGASARRERFRRGAFVLDAVCQAGLPAVGLERLVAKAEPPTIEVSHNALPTQPLGKLLGVIRFVCSDRFGFYTAVLQFGALASPGIRSFF